MAGVSEGTPGLCGLRAGDSIPPLQSSLLKDGNSDLYFAGCIHIKINIKRLISCPAHKYALCKW